MKGKRGAVPGLAHYPELHLDLSVSYPWLLLEEEEGGCGSFRAHSDIFTWLWALQYRTTCYCQYLLFSQRQSIPAPAVSLALDGRPLQASALPWSLAGETEARLPPWTSNAVMNQPMAAQHQHMLTHASRFGAICRMLDLGMEGPV
ncbi:unnamed protein product [Boreogadus saida]